MTKAHNIYSMPNVGCMLGTAYQTLASQLQEALTNAGLDITVSEYLILRTLYDRDGVQQCEIAETLGKDKAAVCRCIRKMLSKGLVRSENVSHKCMRIFVDNEGQRLRDAVLAIGTERHQALQHLLTPDEMTAFANILRKIIDSQ